MAKAKKLPSGSWRCQVYSHTEKVWDENEQEWRNKRIYKSFTSDIPGAAGRREAEFQAAEYQKKKEQLANIPDWTLAMAVDAYIARKDGLVSPTTIEGYRKIRKTAFSSIMDVPLKNLTNDILNRAIREEMIRKPENRNSPSLSPKTVINNWGLISSVLRMYMPDRTFRVDLPKKAKQIRTLPLPREIYQAVKGTNIELACLLAMWLSFSESEIRGLTKSKSIDGDFITIREVLVRVGTQDVRKNLAKEESRNRRHRLPPYIKELISQVEGDIIVPYSPTVLLRTFKKRLRLYHLPDMTFHDLRHVNASVMAMLRIPDKYAMARGGWSSDHIMKQVYMETFDEERTAVDRRIDDYFTDALDVPGEQFTSTYATRNATH